MKKLYIVLATFTFITNIVHASLAADSATLYNGSWDAGSNNGSGFTSWSFNYSGGFGNSGQYIKDDSRWALWANNFGTVEATRQFDALDVGDALVFDLQHTSNIDTGSEVGVTLSKDGSAVFNLKFVGGQSNWEAWDPNRGNYSLSQGYVSDTSLNFSYTRFGDFEYSLDFGSHSAAINFAGVSMAGINQVTFYNNKQGGGQNYSIGDMSVIPEPATIGLLGFIGSSLIIVRRRFAA